MILVPCIIRYFWFIAGAIVMLVSGYDPMLAISALGRNVWKSASNW